MNRRTRSDREMGFTGTFSLSPSISLISGSLKLDESTVRPRGKVPIFDFGLMMQCRFAPGSNYKITHLRPVSLFSLEA
jgi:hypothetical protein